MTRILIAIALSLFVTASSWADVTAKKKKTPASSSLPTEPGALFKKLDTNSDGKLSLDEFKALADKLPKQTAKKKTTAAKPDLEKIFKLLDKNSDGSLSEKELETIGTQVKLAMEKKKKAN